MADFRKWFYALAVVALLAGLTRCRLALKQRSLQLQQQPSTNPIVRAEGYTEQVGDLALNCTGGVPTPLGTLCPVNYHG